VTIATVPTGTVSFLFTDIEGSTRLWQLDPEAMKAALGRHHVLVQQAIEANGGYVFQIIGDAFCAAFHTGSAGVAAALAAQRALSVEPWGPAGPIRVRMAVHTGTVDVRMGEHKSGEYVSGLTLSHTARLLSVANGGQILVSTATQALVRDHLPPRVKLLDLGWHRLRDLARAEPIFQVVAPDLPHAFPALKSVEAVPNNLPRQLTTFIGREREIGDVKRLLAEAHLLTVTGTGGNGKTRLSLEVASGLLDEYPAGVWLLEFAALSDPALVPQGLATTLGVREEPGRPLLSTLVEHLRPQRALLVFDNCEHLIEACARLVDAVLHACPQVKILASSREPLGLTGEVAFRIPPLSMPDPRRLPPLERFTEYEAIRLFVDRAAAVKPGFLLTEGTMAAVAQICQRLDGIPLAIELAAARVRSLSVHQIAAHLDERFRLLTGGSRTAMARHQTLRGLIDWSYALLSDAERSLLRRLSVFAGGWTLAAGEAVGTGHDVDRDGLVELLGRLVDKSLVLMDDQGQEVRYRLLETIRQYALDKLAETSEAEAVRDRHRDFFVGFAEDTEKRLQGREQVVGLKRFEVDHDNLRAALRWSLDREDTEVALRLGSALWLFWDTRGYIREGREWVDELLARANALPASAITLVSQRARAKLLDGAGRLRARWSEYAKACELDAEALAVWRELGDQRGMAEALNNLGVGMRYLGDRARSKVAVEEGLALFRGLADRRGIAHALNNLAELARIEGDLARARALFEESVPLFEAIEDERGLSYALDNLGGILTAQGDYTRAEMLYGRSLQLAEELGDKHAIATALRSLGGVAHHRRDHVRARGLFEDSVTRFREMNDGVCLAKSLTGFAVASHDMGDHEQARVLGDQGLTLLREADAKGELALRLNELGRAALTHGDVARAACLFHESLELCAEAHDTPGIVTTLADLARVAAAHGHPSVVVRLLGAVDAQRRAGALPCPDGDRDVCDQTAATARAQLNAATGDAAWSEGAAMTLEQAVAHARALVGDLPAG
jgi:predicted ATPase/class 3 adenylate cyclase/tetratricopeptide (TPR) repeat protein